jgi:hypothetical protein
MADKDLLATLHDSIADLFIKKLEGKGRNDLTAAELGVIIKFLKDNDITAAPVPAAKTTKIAQILPFPSGEDELALAEG